MIRSLEGVVLQQTGSRIILMTKGGVGYAIQLQKATFLPQHEPVYLYTHLVVRENCLELYGFVSETDLEFFELLMTLPKIGPKSAMQILDQATVGTIVEAVHTEDPGYLSKMTGLGKKTAENIVNGLKGKLDGFVVETVVTVSAEYQDAFDALLSFGYDPKDVRKVLEALDTHSTSDLITQALKQLR